MSEPEEVIPEAEEFEENEEEIEEVTIEDGEIMGEDVLGEKVKKVSKHSPRKYMLKDEGEAYSFLKEGEEVEEEGETRLILNKAIIRAIILRPNMMKILIFLYKRNEPYFKRELAEETGIYYGTLGFNLTKLVKNGIIKIVPCLLDRTVKYYGLTDRQETKKIINRYHWLISFKLAKLLSLNRTIRVEDLKKDTKYRILCHKYGLTVDEGIEALKLNNHKVEQVFSDYHRGELIGFKRKEQ